MNFIHYKNVVQFNNIKMKQEEISRGKKNWLKVKNIILSKNLLHKHNNKKFQLFKKKSTIEDNKLITSYHYKHYQLIQAAPQPLYKQLLYFNSEIDATGKWVWEAEEIAAYYLIHQSHRYTKSWKVNQQLSKKQQFKVMQLGAGCSGLASIAFAKLFIGQYTSQNIQIRLTDGQKQNIQYLSLNLQLNNLKGTKFRADHMKWGDQRTLHNLSVQKQEQKVFDLILVCDCLYFTEFHKELLISISSFLSQDGKALLVNPKRGDSMRQFLQIVQTMHLSHQIIQFQDKGYKNEIQKVKQSINYNEDKDIPYFIELKRISDPI